ncbi:dipeptide epimerase [Enterovibrio norvegicus FF-162]|uniref:Dipeptide epimerase n=1 Tax=Enterovibrio norvegicus FF-454 TaxID=1185651 RepID=A0A1E5CBK9_9GAMM|nr:L-Ala-D/L-Glu epimerase [Enterovibrio norvegicus]OEE62879.1 dipeptide epimerase [Enterovibrio norvegicus FF-454]OEE76560.1 dipeptide epimerase [Enterovibrio norvegicus FF-162]
MKISANIVTYTLKRPFTISRGSRTTAEVIQVSIEKNGKVGVGECSPTGRYGESFDSVLAEIESVNNTLFDRTSLKSFLPPGAARNGLDCALWDLETDNFPDNFSLPKTIQTAMTVSIGSPQDMANEAKGYVEQGATLIKIKLDADLVYERLAAVRAVAPDTTLVVDANEAWGSLDIATTLNQITSLNIAMVEQPLPADNDEGLRNIASPIPLCADESCHTADDVIALVGKYQMVNIKLDKTGGLTAAFELEQAARTAGLQIMVGCMLGSSIAMRAALPVAATAIMVDLDGAFLISDDIDNGLHYQRGNIVLR